MNNNIPNGVIVTAGKEDALHPVREDFCLIGRTGEFDRTGDSRGTGA